MYPKWSVPPPGVRLKMMSQLTKLPHSIPLHRPPLHLRLNHFHTLHIHQRRHTGLQHQAHQRRHIRAIKNCEDAAGKVAEPELTCALRSRPHE